jgi:hypothetical protein
MSNKHEACNTITQEKPSAWLGHRNFANWLVETVQPKITVDLGVDWGHSTFYLAEMEIGDVYGVDSFEGDNHAGIRDTFEYVTSTKEKYKFDNITFIKGYFDQVASTWDKQIDILHIDGFHTYDAVKNDYETWKGFLKEESVVIFHDTEAFPADVGKFFDELEMPYKMKFIHSAGLGIATRNLEIMEKIRVKFF